MVRSLCNLNLNFQYGSSISCYRCNSQNNHNTSRRVRIPRFIKWHKFTILDCIFQRHVHYHSLRREQYQNVMLLTCAFHPIVNIVLQWPCLIVVPYRKILLLSFDLTLPAWCRRYLQIHFLHVISIRILPKFIYKYPIDDISTLVPL